MENVDDKLWVGTNGGLYVISLMIPAYLMLMTLEEKILMKGLKMFLF